MITFFSQSQPNFLNYIITHKPLAVAYLKGNGDNPNIDGKVEFYQTNKGVLVLTNVDNLPQNETGNFFAMHIHEGENCNKDNTGNFEDSNHLNLGMKNHPLHTGDLPVLLSNNGYAFSLVLTDRFTVNEILNKTIMIHQNADDFRTEPSGNSGTKIACGKIFKLN